MTPLRCDLNSLLSCESGAGNVASFGLVIRSLCGTMDVSRGPPSLDRDSFMSVTEHQLQSTHRQPVRFAAWSLFVVCVSASLWQAPLPWLHCHNEEQVRNNEAFARHLSIYHDGEDGTGWHFHFALLEDILRGEGCPVPTDSDGPDASVWLVTQLDSNDRHHSFDYELRIADFIHSERVLPVSRRVDAAPLRNPLQHHTKARRLLALICVCRC